MNTRTLFLLFPLLFLIFACTQHSQKKAMMLFEQGKALEDCQLPDSAIIVYQEAIKELKNIKGDTLSGVIYNRIGDLMYGNSLYADAFTPYSKALPYNLKMNDKTETSRSLRGMGKSVSLQSLNDSAIVYFKRALTLTTNINDKEEISLIHNNLSLAYFELINYKLSLKHNAKALLLSQDSINIYKNFSIRGRLFMQMSQYDSASIYYKLGSKSKNLRTQATCIYGLMEWCKAIGNIDSTKYMNIFYFLKDSIERQNKSFKILNKDKQFQVKEAQKAEKNKAIYWIASIFILCTLFAFVFLKRHRAEKKKHTGDLARHRSALSELEREQKKQTKELERHREKERELKEQVFKTTPIVRKIKTLNSLKAMQRKNSEQEYILTLAELDELELAVDLRFDDFAKRLRKEFPKLTDDDILLCCLLKMKVPGKNIYTLLETNELALKKRRYRIKHTKMELPETIAGLDDFLSDY